MRFPVFSSDYCWSRHHFCSCGPSTARRGCCSGSTTPPRSSQPSWPAGATAAAAFIPLMMMEGPRYQGEPCHRRHTEPSSSQRPQGFCAGSSMPSRPDLNEAFSAAQRLLGEMFGQSPCPSPSAAEKRGNRSGGQSASPPQGKGSDKTTTASRRRQPQACSHDASDWAPKSSHCEKKTGSDCTPVTVQKTEEDQRAKGKPESNNPCKATDSQVWRHSLHLPGVAPNKVSVKVRNSTAYVHAVKEVTYGPGTCLSRLETTQMVTLPENIDLKTLTCSMKQNGTLLLQARFKDSLADKNKTAQAEMLADKAEKADTVDNKMLKTDAQEDESQTETVSVTKDVDQAEVSVIQEENGSCLESGDSAEHLNTSNSSATRMETPVEIDYISQTNSGDLQALDTMEEQTQIDADSDEPLWKNTVDSVETSDGSGIHTSAEKAAACCTGEVLTSEKSDEIVEMTDPEEVENQSSAPQMEGESRNQTTSNNADPSFPIIEEPEDDWLSSDENLLPCSTVAQQSSTEDFVVIEDPSITIECINSEDENDNGMNDNSIQTETEATSLDQIHTEEDVVGEVTDGQIDTLDETDPTRPIKRSHDEEPTHDLEANGSTSIEQSGKVSSSSGGTRATDQKHGSAFSAFLPLEGFKPEEVHANLQGHVLHIVAQRQAWLGEAPYVESVVRDLELPDHLDVLTVKCVYQQGEGCLVITADSQSQQRQVPVLLQ